MMEKPLKKYESEFYDLHLGESQYQGWKISVTHGNDKKADISGWQHVWNDKVEVTLPIGNYRLGPVDLHASYPGEITTISKWWTNEKVPAFMRQMIPVIWNEDHICHEFLSGRKTIKLNESQKIQISIEHL